MKKILSLFLTLAIVIGLFVPAASAETTTPGANTTKFAFLVTSDLHGQIYSTDYSAGYEASGTGTTGLTRIATYIKQMREEYGKNLYLADLGDTIQGAPLTYYYAFNKPEADDPAMKAFRTLGYDLWVPGNHEFNCGLDILNRQMNYLTSAASGKEVRTRLECSASKIYENNGKLDIKDGLTYYDVIHGDGFSYTIDAAQPVGYRVVRMTYNAKPVTDDQEFTVVLNNYRFNGGGDYVNYPNSHDCNFKANDPDRIIYSSQFDMIKGEDEGQARSLLVNYIKEQTAGQSKGITPNITSNWKIINSNSAKSDDIVVLYTNDVHTYIDNKTGNGLRYSDVAGYRDDLRDTHKNVLLVDAGDHVQGTAYGGMDSGATILKLMQTAGYDLATLGNHEFDYGMERALAIANNGTSTVTLLALGACLALRRRKTQK